MSLSILSALECSLFMSLIVLFFHSNKILMSSSILLASEFFYSYFSDRLDVFGSYESNMLNNLSLDTLL